MSRPEGSIAFVASTGGHLEQLTTLAKAMHHRSDSVWVTFDTPQSRGLLAGQLVEHVRYIEPRDWRNTLRSVPLLFKLLRKDRFDAVVSTGAAIALPALAVARIKGIRAVYIESVSRVVGPSLTGRIVAMIPGVETYTQHRAWSSSRWRFDMSLFDEFSLNANSRHLPAGLDRPVRIFVTLGTIAPYRFDSLIDSVVKVSQGLECDIVWQVGCTTRADLIGQVHQQISSDEFEQHLKSADVVVSHAGVGSCLKILRLGIRPIIVPRRSSRKEHVDDHQTQIASDLAARGLVDYVEAGALTKELVLGKRDPTL